MHGAASGVRCVHDGIGLVGKIVLAQRLPDMHTACGQKGIRHAAANNQMVDLFD